MDKKANIKKLNGQTISASMYYYGCDFSTWDNMLYTEAIVDRKDKAFALYAMLYDEEQKGVLSFEDATRLNKVYKAYIYNKKLINERELIL